mmetsp:Transcript_26948/g.41762  ORF Transcript_26948/g.41762 Transcript_26948/m.41762 type:complete len:96 (-) Transcript_26948:2289-2576(-)
MLVSIFELQGDGDIFRIRDVAKNSFDRFMSQAGEHLESGHSKRESLLKFITDTKRVTEKSDDADFEKAYPASLDYDSDPGRFQYLGEAFEDFFYP